MLQERVATDKATAVERNEGTMKLQTIIEKPPGNKRNHH